VPSAFSAAKSGSFEDFVAVYDPTVQRRSDQELTLLHRAMGNRHLDARVAIANHLLDQGADADARVEPEGYTALHILFGQTSHDFDAEVPLVQRLLAGGTDVNAIAAKWGTAMQTLAGVLKFSDEELAPFYDVLFARDDLDLVTPAANGRSTLESTRLLAEGRTDLAARMDRYLAAHA
jgi:hypothetical protein